MEWKIFLKWAALNAHEIVTALTVFASMTLQYIFGDKKGWVAFYVTLASTLVTGFTLHLALNYIGVAADSPIRTMSLILSSFIGTTFLVIISKFLAPALAAKLLSKIKDL